MSVCTKKIVKIRTGGQSGVDRAAMDFAIEHGIPYCGWCPKGGWAEDYPDSPGLLRDYPDYEINNGEIRTSDRGASDTLQYDQLLLHVFGLYSADTG